MKPYETATHVMRAGRMVPKPKPITLPLNDPLRVIRRQSEALRRLSRGTVV